MGDDWTGKFDFLSTVKEYTISFKLDASAETKAAVLPPPGEDLSPDKSSIATINSSTAVPRPFIFVPSSNVSTFFVFSIDFFIVSISNGFKNLALIISTLSFAFSFSV